MTAVVVCLVAAALCGVLPLPAPALAQDKFYFSVSPEDVEAAEGSAATLRCAVSEARGVTYSWRLNGRPLPSPAEARAGARVQQTLLADNEAVLRITRLDRAKDQGEVACIATNTSSGFSLTSRAATVRVL
ncbi:Immunoglobulin superfamily DCC subclass member 3, partial [Frankliniella fusca]